MKQFTMMICGKPNAGKGTAIRRLQERIPDLQVISTSGILKKDPELVKIMNSGQLIPDSIVIKTVIEELKKIKGNFILDGFPRTVSQSKALIEAGIKIPILYLIVSDKEVIRRSAIRMTCNKCGTTYAKEGKYASKKEGICDKCGGTLGIRKDESKIHERLHIYHEETKPAIIYLVNNGYDVIKIDSENLDMEDLNNIM